MLAKYRTVMAMRIANRTIEASRAQVIALEGSAL